MRFWHCSKPTIAAVHGACLAGAFELALACDLTIAAEDAIFGEPELKFGAGIVTMLLPWVTGPKQAKEIILLGLDRIDAATAQRLGIVNRVVPAGTHVDTALRIAQQHRCDRPEPDAADTKKAINRSYEVARYGLRAQAGARHRPRDRVATGPPTSASSWTSPARDGLKAALAWRDARFAD